MAELSPNDPGHDLKRMRHRYLKSNNDRLVLFVKLGVLLSALWPARSLPTAPTKGSVRSVRGFQ